MSKHTHVWSWPIAGYLFLGGLGAGMIIVATVADLAFGLGSIFIPCAAGSIVALGLGSFLLIFELGRPFQFWRVFSKEKAILTFGAWMVIALVIFDIIYFSFWFVFIPWSGIVLLRQIIGVICLLLGWGVMLYTGVELSSMKARVFWNTPVLPVLFVLSGLLVGAAADNLLIGVWPKLPDLMAPPFIESPIFVLASVQGYLKIIITMLTVLVLVATFVYVLMMYFAGSSGARKAATRWLTGSYAWAFWGGLVIVGLIIPLFLQAFNSPLLLAFSWVCIIIGGLCLRFLVVYCDDRRELNGEALYQKRLPDGDEDFLKCNW
jgi:polysulfide reductase chain C